MAPVDRTASNLERARLRPERDRLRKLLRGLRLTAKMDQTAVAKRLGRPQSFVSRYESGERRLDLAELGLVCKALGVTLSDIVRRFEKGTR